MTESFSTVEMMISAGMGALIAIYVILIVMLLLGVFALLRLAVLSKRMKGRSGEEKDCENCEKLAEKDAEIAALQDRLKEQEAQAKAVPAPAPKEEPAPAPVVILAAPEKTLSESLVAVKETGAIGVVSKKSIIAYLSDKYGDKVELNGRANKTPNGKLLLSDNHFAFSPDGKRVCFTYVYETEEGQVLSLIRLDEGYVSSLSADHPGVARSSFPKNKAKDWYSVVADDTFTAEAYYAVFDHAIALISASDEQTEPEPEAEVTLKESLAAAKETGAVGIVSKKSIIAHLDKTFGDKVELNGRENRTPNGKLLMSDNHFAFAPDGKRVCFTYIYEDDDGKITILLRTTAEHAKDIRSAHKLSGTRSAFPKNKEHDWYSVIVDDTFTEAGVYAELDRAALNIIGGEIAIPEPEPEAEVTLKESLAAAKETGAVGIVSKKSIIEHLDKTFGDKVELNGRENRTPNGKLLMSDNHFAFAPDGKRVCFTYIYEDDDGKITILLRTTADHAKDLRAAHKNSGTRSAFPKNKEHDWYSVIVDDSFTEAGVYAELDRAAINIIGGEIAIPEPEPEAEVTLKESLAAAKETGAVGIVSKKTIIEHLDKTFGDKVELNGRENRTPNGKLLMSDNHFAFAPDGKRVCFTYIYEDDDGKITILLRTTAEHAKDIRSAHKLSGTRSAFPKNKEHDWYSVIVDDTFTEAGVYAELDRAALNIIGASIVIPEPEPEAEVTLKESLAAAKETGAVGIVSKKTIIEHLDKTFGDKVELNGRENRTPNGKLLMSDNHFAFAPDGKRVCFTYIYEDDDGKITILLRTTAEHAKDIRSAHKLSGTRSAFPKNKEHDWYSVIVDDSFAEAGVYAELDRAAINIIGASRQEAAPAPSEEIVKEVAAAKEPIAEAVEERAHDGRSLKESLAVAKGKGAHGLVSKKSVMAYLADAFGEKVELNGRANRTPNGKLLMSDNHFALGEDRVCFTYVYEDDDGAVTLLVRLNADTAAARIAKHGDAIAKSSFPKNKESDWYSVVVDDSFTESEIQSILQESFLYVFG